MQITIIVIKREVLARMQGYSLHAEILLSKRLNVVMMFAAAVVFSGKNQSIYSLAVPLFMNMKIQLYLKWMH